MRLAVNQNMRYDQSIRALKTLLTRGDLGRPVLATIEMRAIPHWQTWLRDYVWAPDAAQHEHPSPGLLPLSLRRSREHLCERGPGSANGIRAPDGIALYILEYADGMRACGWDDVWAGPAREGAAADLYIKWRVEGTDGMAEGTIGWPDYPNAVPQHPRLNDLDQPCISDYTALE